MTPSHHVLTRTGAPSLAIKTWPALADKPHILFLGGFRSDMTGTKADFLSRTFPQKGWGLTLFDYRGHGRSAGAFEDGTITLWLYDVFDVLATIPAGQVLLVGSSMGGWLSLLAARDKPQRIKGMIGLAVAPDFTGALMARATNPQRMNLQHQGFFMCAGHDGVDYPVTQSLIDDGEKNFLLKGGIIDILCPVRLIHGQQDDIVPWQITQKITNALGTKDHQVFLQKDGDHRLSAPADLALLQRVIESFG